MSQWFGSRPNQIDNAIPYFYGRFNWMMNQTFTNWKWVEMGGHHPKQIILKWLFGVPGI